MQPIATSAEKGSQYRVSCIRRWIVFNLVGGLGIIVQLSVLATLTGCCRWNYLLATAAAVEAAVLHNFVWHERWTWGERAGGGKAAALGRLARFHLTNGVFSLVGNLLLMKLFVARLGLDYAPANLLAIAVCSILNFLAGDRFVYVVRPTSQEDGGLYQKAEPRKQNSTTSSVLG